MNIKEIKRLYNLVLDLQVSDEELYIIRYIDDNGEVYPIIDIQKNGAFDFTIVWEKESPIWGHWENLSAEHIYVYKEIFWNKKQTDLK